MQTVWTSKTFKPSLVVKRVVQKEEGLFVWTEYSQTQPLRQGFVEEYELSEETLLALQETEEAEF